MDLQLIAAALFLLLIISVVSTRIAVKQRNKRVLRNRVQELIPLTTVASSAIAEPVAVAESEFLLPAGIDVRVRQWIELAGWNARPLDVVISSVCIGALVGTALFVLLSVNPFLAVIPALMVAVVPWVCLFVQAQRTKRKMSMQLPNALDLMVSVLKSGHSIPQSLKAVANEMPQPCGREFGEVLHRVSLGQSLSEALTYTVARYDSFEIDLLRRAFHIHSEVGGSLAELLDKTNKTLRDRIRLKRHVETLTGPSRLSAIIVGLLPFVMAIGFFIVAPTYLEPLFKTKMGQVLMTVGLILQTSGYLIMRRMANYKV
jgi:tight adherence protein B